MKLLLNRFVLEVQDCSYMRALLILQYLKSSLAENYNRFVRNSSLKYPVSLGRLFRSIRITQINKGFRLSVNIDVDREISDIEFGSGEARVMRKAFEDTLMEVQKWV